MQARGTLLAAEHCEVAHSKIEHLFIFLNSELCRRRSTVLPCHINIKKNFLRTCSFTSYPAHEFANARKARWKTTGSGTSCRFVEHSNCDYLPTRCCGMRSLPLTKWINIEGRIKHTHHKFTHAYSDIFSIMHKLLHVVSPMHTKHIHVHQKWYVSCEACICKESRTENSECRKDTEECNIHVCVACNL